MEGGKQVPIGPREPIEQRRAVLDHERNRLLGRLAELGALAENAEERAQTAETKAERLQAENDRLKGALELEQKARQAAEARLLEREAYWRDRDADKTELRHKEQEEEARKSRTDDMTGLWNKEGFYALFRPLFQETLHAAVNPEEARESNEKRENEPRFITVLFIDGNKFKRINDEHGHAFGDEVIRIMGDTIHGAVRDTDIVARWGGDEFLVAFEHGSMRAPAKVKEHIEESFKGLNLMLPHQDGTLHVSASIGIATFGPSMLELNHTDGAEMTPEALVELADQAMQREKEKFHEDNGFYR